MKKLYSLTLCAAIAPAMALGAGVAYAQQGTQTPEGAQPRSTPDSMQRQTPQGSQQRSTTGSERSSGSQGSMQRDSALGQQRSGRDSYLSSRPSNGFQADDLIGSSIRSRADNSDIGSISDLIIDSNGQVVAVIVGVGGFLGMGQKDVAISWDDLQRTPKTTGRGYDYHIDASEDSLRSAPTYGAVR